MRNLIYLRPKLYDLSQGTRIKFVRVFRHLTQDNVSDDLGITGENKRRTLTRYEKGERNPSKSRLKELSNILLINDNLIKQYEFKSLSDILYFLLWLEEIDGIVKELNDDETTIFMVDSNMYRKKLLPSEKAFAYRMKMEAIKHQGKTSCHNGTKLRSDEKLSEKSNDSARQIQRYIRLTYLIPELLEIVDNTSKIKDKNNLTMGLLPAVELSFLSKHEQQEVYSVITYEDVTPSHGQTIRIKKLSTKNY